MKSVRKLLHGQILGAVAFATAAFLALFFFFDLVEELQRLGRGGYTLSDALWTCLLALPGHLYDLLPITMLIGSTFALARLAQTSEFTILRTAGLGPGRALSLLASLGVAGAIAMVLVGEWLMPWSEQAQTTHLAASRQGQALKLGRGGAWLRDTGVGADGRPVQVTINVGSALGEERFQDVRIFQFDTDGSLLRRVAAREARIQARDDGTTLWSLHDVADSHWLPVRSSSPVGAAAQRVREQHLPELQWPSSMAREVVSASVLPIDTMSIVALWRYTRHLAANAQAAQKYELQFWKKAFAPLACVVMVALALPFAYLQSRSGGISVKVFGGIMLGISFVLVNHISAHLGLLHQWTPWVAALAPSVVYTLLSLSVFLWLVRNR